MKWLKFFPLILLLLVAANHFRLVKMRQITPWKGGGFGMFSTVDARNARALKILAQVDGRMVEVMPMGKLDKLVSEFISLPDTKSKNKIIELMKGLKFYLNIESSGLEFVINEELMSSKLIETPLEFELIHERYFYQKTTKTLEKKEIWRERFRL
jgi:hypothetical protein